MNSLARKQRSQRFQELQPQADRLDDEHLVEGLRASRIQDALFVAGEQRLRVVLQPAEHAALQLRRLVLEHDELGSALAQALRDAVLIVVEPDTDQEYPAAGQVPARRGCHL
jgi:hypothetical protein